MISALADDNPVVRAGRADRRGVQLRRGGPWLDIERPRKRIEINGNTVVDAQPFGSTAGRVWQENFLGSFLKQHNTMTVSKNSAGADVKVSDFIVHFKTL